MQVAAFKTLKAVGWLSTQTAAFQESFLSHASVRIVSSGKTVFHMGESSDYIVGVGAGHLEVVVAASHYQPFLGHISRPGAWIGFAAAVHGSDRLVDLRARGDVTVVQVPASGVSKMAKVDPEAWRIVGQIASRNAMNMLSFAASRASGNMTLRVAETLLRLARPVAPGETTAEIPLTQAELATICGLSRNSVVRTLAPLVAERAVERSYGRIVVHPGALERILQRL